MKNLGQILKENQEKTELEKAQRAAAERKEEDRKFKEKYEMVERWFNNAKAKIEEKIMAGKDNIRISNRASNSDMKYSIMNANGKNQMPIQKPTHEFYPIWADFEQWIDDNGLIAIPHYEHDGAGMESWTSIEVACK